MESITANILGIKVDVDRDTFVANAKTMLPFIIKSSHNMIEKYILNCIWTNVLMGDNTDALLALQFLPPSEIRELETELDRISSQTKHWFNVSEECERLGLKWEPIDEDWVIEKIVSNQRNRLPLPQPTNSQTPVKPGATKVPRSIIQTDVVDTLNKRILDEDGIVIDKDTYYFINGSYYTLYTVRFSGAFETVHSLREAKDIVNAIRNS